MKILVVGDGKLGETLVKQLLEEGHNITLVDSNSAVLENCVNRYDVMTVHGNCVLMDTLEEAGVKHAELLIAVTGVDEVNLLCCTTAHYMNPKLHTVARIRNPEYEEQAYAMQDAFALSMVVNPEKQAAHEMGKLLNYPAFLKRDSFAKGRIEIVELKIDAKSKLCNLALCKLSSVSKCQILICSVLRDGKAFMPTGSFVMKEGDRIFVTAPSDELSIMLKDLNLVTKKIRKVMLVGGGRISYYLSELLLRSRMDVHIVEKDEEQCIYLATQLPAAKVVQGDACDQTVLESQGLDSCDALVTMTGVDEMNMVISLYGNSIGVPKVITKISWINNSNLLNNLQLGSVVSPRLLTCDTIVRYVRALQNQTGAATAVYSIADGQAEALEFPVGEDTLHRGELLKNLKLKENILLVGISRNNKTIIPKGDSFFEVGDSVVVVSGNDSVLLQLNDIFDE